MHIIIIANHQPVELSPLTDNSCTAMLAIGGKPLIEHLLENAANIPHEKMTIVASRAFSVLRKHIETGERWGLEIDYISSRPNESLASVKRRQPEFFPDNLLVLSADRIYTTDLSELYKDGESQIRSEDPSVAYIEQPSVKVSNHLEYLDLSLAAVRGEIPQINLRGSERAVGLRTGYQSRISPSSVYLGRTHTGNHCQVDKSAQLKGTVVLESSVVVDRNTTIEDSIVLEHTYIGEQLSLKRSIVSGRYMIRVDEGVVIKLTDSFMAAPLQKGVYDAHLAGPINQLTGLIAGIIVLPVMLVGVLTSLWENPYQPFVKKSWVSNLSPRSGVRYRTYDTFEFNVSNQALRKLPQVLDISLGHLRWFGVSVATETELDSRKHPGHMVRDKCPTGLIGIAQISPDDNTNANQRFAIDAKYVATANTRTNLQIVKKGLLKLFRRENQEVDELQQVQ